MPFSHTLTFLERKRKTKKGCNGCKAGKAKLQAVVRLDVHASGQKRQNSGLQKKAIIYIICGQQRASGQREEKFVKRSETCPEPPQTKSHRRLCDGRWRANGEEKENERMFDARKSTSKRRRHVTCGLNDVSETLSNQYSNPQQSPWGTYYHYVVHPFW